MSNTVAPLPLRWLGQAVALVTAEYGDRYVDRRIYHPLRLLWAVLSGSLTLFCVADGDKLKGIIALRRTPQLPHAVEISMQVVEKTHRRQGLGGKLADFALQYALQQNASCCFGHCVTGHSFSQAELERCGFVASGLLFSRYDEGVLYPDNSAGGRHTLVVMVRAGQSHQPPLLYPPLSLIKETIQYYQGRAAVAIYPKSGTYPCTQAHTQLHVVDDSVHRSCELFICKVGTDFTARLAQVLQKKPHDSSWSFNVYLNLLHPSCHQAYSILLQKGFFFSGFHPHCHGAEYLLLHAQDKCIDFGQLCTTPCVGKLVEIIEPFYTARRQQDFLALWRGSTDEALN